MYLGNFFWTVFDLHIDIPLGLTNNMKLNHHICHVYLQKGKTEIRNWTLYS